MVIATAAIGVDEGQRAVRGRGCAPSRAVPTRSCGESGSDAACAGDENGCETGAGGAAEPFDRPGHRDRRDAPRRRRRAPAPTPTPRRPRAAPTDCAQPRRRTSASVRVAELGVGQHVGDDAGSDQAHSTCAPEPAVIGSRAPTGTVVRSPCVRSAAATHTRSRAVAAVELRALAALVAHPGQHRRRRRPRADRAAPAASSPSRGPSTKRPVGVAAEQPVHLQRHRQPVRGRPRQRRSPSTSSASARGAVGHGSRASPPSCPARRCR